MPDIDYLKNKNSGVHLPRKKRQSITIAVNCINIDDRIQSYGAEDVGKFRKIYIERSMNSTPDLANRPKPENILNISWTPSLPLYGEIWSSLSSKIMVGHAEKKVRNPLEMCGRE